MALLPVDFVGLPNTVAAGGAEAPRNSMHLILEEKVRMGTDLVFALAHRLPTYDLGRVVLPAGFLTDQWTDQWLDYSNFPGPSDVQTAGTGTPVVGAIVAPLAADCSASARRRAHE